MKRAFSILLALVMLLSLAACAHQAPAPSAEADTLSAEDEEDLVTRVSTLYPLPAGCSVTALSPMDHTLLLAGEQDGAYLTGLCRLSLAEDGTVILSELRQLSPDEPEAPDELRLHALTAGADGLFYVLTGEEPGERRRANSLEIEVNPDYQGRYSLLCYNAEGSLAQRIRIRDWPYPEILRVLVDGEGRIFLTGKRSIAQIDRDGAILSQLELDEDSFVGAAQLCREGAIFEVFDNKTHGSSLLLSDGSGELRQLPAPDPAQIPGFFGSFLDMSGLDGEALVLSGRTVYRYVPDSGAVEPLLDMSGIIQTPAADLCRMEERLWLFLDANGDLNALRLVPVTRAEQQTVRVAMVRTEAEAVTRFFNDSADYRCEVEHLSPTALLTALGAGDCPDLVVFGQGLNSSSPLFDDLYPYLDADPELSREDFLPNLLPALETDGQLHEIWPKTLVYSLAIRSGDLQDGKLPESCADYDALLAANPQRSMLFEPFMDRGNLFGWVSVMSTGEFVDRQTGTCRFDSPEFIELLEWCGAQHPDYGEGSDYTGPIWNVDYTLDDVLLRFEVTQSVKQLPVLREYYGPVTFVGFPGGEGRGSYYGLDSYDSFSMAIPKNSRCKDGAWACVRSLLLPEGQISLAHDWRSGTGIPVNRQALERVAADEGLKAVDLKQLDELLENTTKASNETDNTLLEIIRSAGNAYLAGDKSAEETARIIQSKAGIYLAEQYG